MRPIVINHNLVPNTDQANFPFLFNTTDPAFAATANGGHMANINAYDLIFSTDPAGQNQLNYEIEEYNPVTGQIIAWIGIPSLSHTTDTVLYMFYGNAAISASQQNRAGVWDANFMGVWHVPNGTQLSLADSTGNGDNATNNGATATVGQIDGGMASTTGNATIGVPANLANLAHGNATFSAWVNPSIQSGGGTSHGIVLGKGGYNEGWSLAINESGQLGFVVYDSDNSYRSYPVSGQPLSSGWSHVAATVAQNPAIPLQSLVTLYVNGVPSGSSTITIDNPVDDSSLNAYLAGNTYDFFDNSTFGPFYGSDDEFRISNIARSGDWIATEYNNQSSPSKFYSLYPENISGSVPSTATLYASQSQQFNAIAPCSALLANWSMPAGSPGTLTTGGAYTAPSSIATQQTLSITATSQANGSTVGSATVTLMPPVVVSVSPATATIHMPNRTQQFTATVLNATNPAVMWSVSPIGAGTIDQTGLYTPPSPLLVQTVTITATSQLDSTKSASAVVNLLPIILTPADINIYGGYADPITSNLPVNWSVSPSALGTIAANGVFATSPNVTGNQQATVTATLQSDPTASASIVINIYSPGYISPTSVSLYGGQNQALYVCVANTPVTQSCASSASTLTITPAGAGVVTPHDAFLVSDVYYAPAVIPVPQTVVVTATDASNSLISFSSTITLLPPTVAVSPATITLDAGQTEQYFATLKNSGNTAVNWSISPANAGTINASGLYQAPATIATPQTVTITATSQAVPGISASAVVTLSPTQCAAKAYSYVRPIVIDHTKVPNSDQVNFPFLFSTTDPVFATTGNGGHVVNSSGYDIVFSSDPGGVNVLDYELEKYDPVAGQIIAWIRIPTLSHSGDTMLYMFYGNSSIATSQQNAPGVWGDTYLGVWHLSNGTILSADDSTSNGYDGTILSASAATGVIDGGASFAGSNTNVYPQTSSHIDIGDLGAFPPQGTIEFWMNPSSLSSYPNAFTTYYNGRNNAIRFEEDASGDFAAVIGSGSFNGYLFMSASMQPNTWYDTALTWNAALSNATGFLNGTQVFNALTSNLWPSSFPDVAIGGGYYSDRDWLGAIDEVRISNVTRSSDWLAAEYNNERSPSSFFAVYAENAPTVVPASVSLYASQAQQFLAPASSSCGSSAVVWSIPAGSPGTLSQTGFYAAPSSIDSQQTVTVTATTLGEQPQSFSAAVTLLPPVSLSVTPPTATVLASQTQQFAASVSNASNTNVSWTVSPAGMGTINSSGLYIAPTTITAQQPVYITATSQADNSQSASATITLVPNVLPITLSVSPSSATVGGGGTQQFTAAVMNTTNASVTWSITPAGEGTIAPTGLYTAPLSISTQQTVTVTATSQANPAQSASAVITLTPVQCASSGYGFEREILIDHTKVSNTDQVNFPFLFSVTDPTLATTVNGGHVANSNGYDIIFSMDPDGKTRLDSELEEYNPATGQVVAWVRIPTLSHTADTVLYVFYGNPAITASQGNPTGVWDNNFIGVWHLPNGTTLSASDSTVNSNNGTITGASATAGEIDGAATFGNPGFINIPNLSDFASGDFTVSSWVSFSSLPAYNVITVGNNQASNVLFISTQSNGEGLRMGRTGVAEDANATFVWTANTWYHVVLARHNGASIFYVDGTALNTNNEADSSYDYPSSNMNIGGDGANYPLSGSLDEFRISKIARSPDWIATEFNNENSPSTFYTLSAENAEEIVPSAVTLYGSQSQQFIASGSCVSAVTWSLPDGSPGTLTSTGLYTAPPLIASQETVTITATPLSSTGAAGSATVTLMPPVSASITPATITLTENQNQQFTALVANTSNGGVTWTVSPAGMGTIDATGLYSAPAAITAQQTVTVVAISQADPSKSAYATITLAPTQCASNGYGYQNTIVIDHTKVANADQTNFPLLFNTTDPSLASAANGGHVTSPNGYDIIFSTDPNGQTKLDHEIEEYNPVTGQVIAWVRIPTLSHGSDTIIYMFYGNASVTTPQQNPAGVWDSNYLAVYHMADQNLSTTADSTSDDNFGTLTAVQPTPGEIDGAAEFNGSSSYEQIPSADFPNFPTGEYQNIGTAQGSASTTFAATFGVWFKTAQAGGILTQVPSQAQQCVDFGIICSMVPVTPGYVDPPGWLPLMYVDDDGNLEGFVFSPGRYTDNQWHYAVATFANDGTSNLYVDGNLAGTAQDVFPTGYSPTYSYFVGTAYTLLQPEGNWGWLYFNGGLDEVRVSNVPRSGDWIKTEYNNQSSPATFYKYYPVGASQVVPASISLYAAQAEQFAVTGACTTSVTWSMPANTPGTLTSGGLYTAPEIVTSQQNVTITAANQSGFTIGSGTVTLLSPPPPIVLSANATAPYVVGSSQTFTVVMKDQSGAPEAGVVVTFNVSGANNSIGSATTNQTGTASYSYVGTNAGTDTIDATAVVDGNPIASNSVSASWIVPTQVIAASATLEAQPALGVGALMGAFTDSNGAVIEPIAIGASAKEFIVPAGATQLQLGINDEHFADNASTGFVVKINGAAVTVPPTAMPWTWHTGGSNNNYQFGMNDGTVPIVAATGLTEGEPVSIAYQRGTVSPGLPLPALVNANGSQSLVTGTTEAPGTFFPTLYTTTSAYPLGQPITFSTLVTDASGSPMTNVPVTVSVSGANPGQYQITTDAAGTATFVYTGSNAGNDDLQAQAFPSGAPVLTSEQINVTWTSYPAPPPVDSLSLSYFATDVNLQAYTVLVKDAAGNPIHDANVGFYVSGADNFQKSANTDVTGQTPFDYYHVNPGNFSIVAVTTIDRNVILSNTITGTWTVPSNTTSGNTESLTIYISGNTSLTLPNTLQLNGTVTDSLGFTPTIAWSMLSGPGSVTFSSPQAAVTTATFEAPGNYVLVLSASDPVSSGSIQFPVTVIRNPNATTGRIGSPLYGAAVSGIVPITLAPGVNLQSGTLSYYPSNNSDSVTVLNSNTTGTGQIGSLDTTMLANGSYVIQLQSTETNGDSEYDLALVNVVGDYKPGRLTTTVTDLVVPATGLAINIQRNYDSLNTGTIGDFGYGWNLSTNVDLTVDPQDNVTFTLGGQRRTFYLAPQSLGSVFSFLFLPTYSPEPGLMGTLSDAGSACGDSLGFVEPDGSLWLCMDGTPYTPTQYIYTDPSGTKYTISASGNLQSIADKNGNGLAITANGIISSTGLSVPFVRDSSGRVTQITDPQGNNYLYSYDDNGNLATVTYPNTTTPSIYTYDANHHYTGGTDARGNPLPITTYYGPDDTDPNGLSLNGRVKSGTDALSQTRSYTYDLVKNSMTVTFPQDGSGNVGSETSVDDAYGDMLSYTSPLGFTTTYTYDANRNRISTTDPLGHKTTYSYDPNGNTTSITYPATATSTNTTSYTAYNQYSEPTSATDELGNVKTFNYDANYNPQSVTDSLGTVASFIFNGNGQIQAGAAGYDITAQPGKASQYAYDANGNLASSTDALGRTTSYTYDALGHKLSTTVPIPGSNSGGASFHDHLPIRCLGQSDSDIRTAGRCDQFTI